jgi:hypothetical protein
MVVNGSVDEFEAGKDDADRSHHHAANADRQALLHIAHRVL